MSEKPARSPAGLSAKPGIRRCCFSIGGLLLIILLCLASVAAQEETAADADRLNQQVFQLYQQGRYAEAIAVAEYIVEICKRRQGSDPLGYAASLNSLAALYYSTGQYQKAADYFTQSLPLFRALDDRGSEAKTLYRIGAIYSSLGEKRKALEYFAQALPLERNLGDRSGEAATLTSIGTVYSRLGDLRKALEYYNQALPLVRAADNRSGEDASPTRASTDRIIEATILNNIGTAYDGLGEKQKALEYYNQVLPIRQTLGDPVGLAATLNNIGAIYSYLGEKQKALDYFARSLLLQQGAGDRSGEAATLNNIGRVYDDLGEKQKALEYYNQALPLQRALGDRPAEASTLNNIGAVYDDLGEKQKALEYYQQALLLRRAVDDRAGEANTLNNLGAVYAELGEKRKALEFYELSLTLSRALGARSGEAVTLTSIGAVYSSLGEKQKALEFYSRALPLQRAMGDRSGEATTLNNIGRVYDDLGEKQKALEYYNQAQPLQRALGDRSGEASTLNNIGAVYDDLGEKQKALGYYNRALFWEREVGNRSVEAAILNNLGTLYDELGEKQKALEHYHQALPLERAVGDCSREAATLASLMWHWSSQGNASLAIFFGKQAINAIQHIRLNIQGMEQTTQRAFLKSNENTYRYLVDLLVSRGRLFEAQEVLGLLKEQEFKEFTRGEEDGGTAGTLAMTSAERDMEKRYDQVAGAVAALWVDWNALKGKGKRTAEEEARFQQLETQLEEAERSFQSFMEQELYAQLGKNKQADADVRALEQMSGDLQLLLHEAEPGTVAVYTVVAPERLIVILVLPEVRIARDYPIKPEVLREKVFRLWRALSTNSADVLPAAQDVYKIVIGPIEKDLESAHAKTLMWSLDDALRYIPIAALHDGRQYVVEKYRNEVFTLSSLSKLRDAPSVKSWQMLAMGVSKSYGGSQPLPTVPSELQSIVRTNANEQGGLLLGMKLLDEDFTEAALTSALAQRFPLVHIASHFLFQAGVDDLSYLLLGGKTEAGEHLTLAHIKTAPKIGFWNTELLTLSACDTAMSGERNGREIDGLGEIVQRKGARAVIASLWSVSDRSTGELMRRFYETWTTHPGMPKAEALRQAQLALLHDEVKPDPAVSPGVAATPARADAVAEPESFAHPFYWAPFILIGNWR